MISSVKTCLWFDKQGEEAARLYVSLIPESEIGEIFRPDPTGVALVVNFTLRGVPFMALNGGPSYVLNEAASIVIQTTDQQETDRLWTALTSGGGKEGRCGWLKDRFGVSWQIVPEALPKFLGNKDRVGAGRAMQKMLTMSKIEMSQIEAAFLGN